jgi:hypothetical protein
MTCDDESAPVDSVRHEISGLRYDSSICRTGDRYFATWLCLTCCVRGQTGRVASTDSADDAASVAIEKHHASYHGLVRAHTLSPSATRK